MFNILFTTFFSAVEVYIVKLKFISAYACVSMTTTKYVCMVMQVQTGRGEDTSMGKS